jgi:hypothetical protein
MPSNDLQDQQFFWLLRELNTYSGTGRLFSYLSEHFCILDHEGYQQHILRFINAGRCPAIDEASFLKWAKRKIDQHAEMLLPFVLADRLKHQNGRLTVSDVQNIVALHGKQRKDTVAFPRTIQNGNVALLEVPNADSILKVPACPDSDNSALNFLPILQLLWPWHERNGKIYKHCSRQTKAGVWTPYRLGLHELFCDFLAGRSGSVAITSFIVKTAIGWTG